MGFKENIRAEQKHFLNLKTLVSLLRRWVSGEKDAKTVDILNSCIEADKALILLYKNMGEIWNELGGAIVAEKARLEALRAELSEFKDEVNGKVDEVNNYLLSLIRDLETRVEDMLNSIANLNGRIGDAEVVITGLDATIEEAKPYQIQIVLPTTGWRTYGSQVYYNAPETVDLTKAAMITFSAGASDLSDYDELFDTIGRAKAISLFGSFDDNGGDPAQSCFQFYADSVPTDPLRVLVTVSPYLSNSTAVSTVVNGIY